MKYHIRQPVTEDELCQYFHLRWKLLRAPWQQLEGTEKDDMETQCIHLMAITDGGTVIGVGRLQYNTMVEAQVRYMAVEKSHERQGIGHRLLTTLERHAVESEHHMVILDARESAVGFYQKSGYSIIEKSYLLFDEIQHYRMLKTLSKQ